MVIVAQRKQHEDQMPEDTGAPNSRSALQISAAAQIKAATAWEATICTDQWLACVCVETNTQVQWPTSCAANT